MALADQVSISHPSAFLFKYGHIWWSSSSAKKQNINCYDANIETAHKLLGDITVDASIFYLQAVVIFML